MLTIPLILYFTTHFAYGPIMNSYGPIIPYLAQQSNREESEFTFILIIRGAAYILAGFLHKSVFKPYSLHRKLFFSCFFTGIGFILFSRILNLWYLGILTFFMSIASGSIEIMMKVVLLLVGQQNAKSVITLSYGIYGIGSIVGPGLVSLLGRQSFLYIGMFSIFVSLGYVILKSPEQLPEDKQKDKLNDELPKDLEVGFCWLFLLYTSITLSIRSWLPSFIVIEEISTKQYAALSISLYSTSLTVFRLLSIFFNADTPKMLMYNCLFMIGIVVCSLISYALKFYFVLVFGSALFLGIAFSAYFTYLLALPNNYGYTISAKNSSNLMIAYATGEAVVSAFVGVLMSLIHPLMLFISLLVAMIINRSVLKNVIRILKECQEENEKRKRLLETEMEMEMKQQ